MPYTVPIFLLVEVRQGPFTIFIVAVLTDIAYYRLVEQISKSILYFVYVYSSSPLKNWSPIHKSLPTLLVSGHQEALVEVDFCFFGFVNKVEGDGEHIGG